MHKTKTGRWQPDKPPEPEPHPVHDHSYDAYLMHRYIHWPQAYPWCLWCCESCLSAQKGNPFAVLENVTLR